MLLYSLSFSFFLCIVFVLFSVLLGYEPVKTGLDELPPIPTVNNNNNETRSLFVNGRRNAMKGDSIVDGLRKFAVKVAGNSVKSISLRSLRQVFQFYFYQSSPSFGDLRQFNMAMDHSDTTGLMYYNKSHSSKISIPIESVPFLRSLSPSHSGSSSGISPSPVVIDHHNYNNESASLSRNSTFRPAASPHPVVANNSTSPVVELELQKNKENYLPGALRSTPFILHRRTPPAAKQKTSVFA